MANVVEQEIRVNIRAVLDGFEALKKVKSDVKAVFDSGNKSKLFTGAKDDAQTLSDGINEINQSINELPAGIAEATKDTGGLVSVLKEVFETGYHVSEIIKNTIKTLEFLGVTGEEVKAKIVGAFEFIRANAAGVVSGIKSIITEAKTLLSSAFASAGQAGGGAVSVLRSALVGLGESLTGALPAIASAGAGIVALGVVAGVTIGAVLALVAAIASVVAVAGGIALAGTLGSAALLGLAASGFEYNAAIETLTLGTAALIAQLSEIKRDGLKLEGIDAVEAGIELAQEQLKKLRVDAIQTTATFEELAQVYQAAVGSGLGAGLDLDQIRQITVSLAQAGAALGVPYDQLRQEVNSILEGTIDTNSRIAKNLGITNEQVKKYKEQGTLAEELNKRLSAFNVAGIKAAATFSGLTSNLREALNVFSGEATAQAFERLKERLSTILSKVFDFKAGGLDAAFKPIADLLDKVLVQSIDRFADGIEAAVSFAKSLGKFLDDNKNVIDDILTLVDSITREFVGMIADVLGLTSDTTTWKNVLDTVRSILKVISGALTSLRIVVAQIAGGFRIAANAIYENLIPAVDGLLGRIPGLRELIGLMSALSGLTAKSAVDSIFGGIEEGIANAFGVSLNDAPGKKGGLTTKGNKNPNASKKGSGSNKASQIADASDDLEKTRIDAAYNEYLANLRKEEQALDESYKNRLISTEQYFADKARVSKETLDAEIVKERYLLELATARERRAKDAAERLQARSEVEAIESRINVLISEVGTKQTEIDANKADALRELNLQYDELKNTLKEIEGLGFEASQSRIDAKFKEILERAAVDGKTDIVETIERIKTYEKTLAKLTETEKGYQNALARRDDALAQIQEMQDAGALDEEQAGLKRIEIERQYKGELLDTITAMIALASAAKEYDKVIALTAAKRKIEQSGDFTTPQLLEQERAKFERLKASLANSQNAVNNQVERGDITPELGDVRRLENERKLKAELQASVNLMRELAAATASLDDDLAVANLASEIENLGVVTDTLGKGIVDSLRDGLGGFFDDLISGTQSLTQSFRSMVSSILSSIARLAANELLRSLFSSGVFKSGGALGFLGGLKFASGGAIGGAGTGTSDSIPIWASNGEYMIKAATVRKLGVGFLNQLNSGNLSGLFSKFATGGAIGQNPAMSAANSDTSSASGGVRIINVIDPALVKDYLATSAGENTILNVLKRNPAYIKQLLA